MGLRSRTGLEIVRTWRLLMFTGRWPTWRGRPPMPDVTHRRAATERRRKNRTATIRGSGRPTGRGSRVGDDLVEAFEEMAKHLRGEIEIEAHPLPGGTLTPAKIKAIRSKVASSTKEFERVFGIPSRTMESYEQGRRRLDGAMRALLRIIDREPDMARRALSR